MIKDIAIGDAVIYTDAYGVDRPALTTAVWGDVNSPYEPAINLVFVSSDKDRTDQYGRQLERNSSVVHQSAQPAHGTFWRRVTEAKKGA